MSPPRLRRSTLNRRDVMTAAAALAAGLAWRTSVWAQSSTPAAGSAAGEWSFTDVLGTTVTLPERPVRIAAYVNTAASLWDFGIEAIAVFGWAATNYPDGDHTAWGNVDADGVAIVGATEDNIDLEKLVAAAPDLIVTWTWDKNDPTNATVGIPADVLGRVAAIAPIIVLNQGDSNDLELARVEALATALGADLQSPELVAEREAFEAKVAEAQRVAAEKSDLTLLFASFGEPDIYYVASPDYVSDAGYVRALGFTLANDGSPTATAYWESLSTEQALKYPCDVIYLDGYGEWDTVEEVQAQTAINLHPAIAAGQVGSWRRDFPLSYPGLSTFLEDILTPLRTAQRVS